MASLAEHTGGYIQIKKAYILFGGIIAASFIAGWFGFYFIEAPQVGNVANSTAFQKGYTSGFRDSVSQIYYFNNQPENLIETDNKVGVATTNGTAVRFMWFDSTANKNLFLNLKSQQNLGQTSIEGTLHLMTSPVKWPQQISQAFNITQTHYMVFQTGTGQRYLLESTQ